MAWTPWENSRSTVIAKYRYDDTRGILQIRSRRSGKIREFDCSLALYEEFLAAPSQGRFLAGLVQVPRRWRLAHRLSPGRAG